ncbi:MAG TPA: chorismate synthase [Bacteroidales bacterium]|nr:chorismate synthase [Bacteroidales bacterium]
MNTFGRIFKLSIFGESHGKGIGIVIDGCPVGIHLKEEDFKIDFDRRRSGARGTTPRIEPDLPEILSGVYQGKTTGSPIAIVFKNTNTQSHDYDEIAEIPRPGHADFTAKVKYQGLNDPRGGGHFSGRITLGLVAAGFIAKKILSNVHFDAKVIEVGGSSNIQEMVEKALAEGDSVGGLIECRISGLPVGIGEPFFDSIESMISHLIFSIPATKGIEFGAGFAASKMKGSEHNDSFVDGNGKTQSNHAGGINGGISNGNDLVFRVAVKPTSSIQKTQHSFNLSKNKMEDFEIVGRHDACIALRIPVIIEAAAAMALADLFLIQQH